MDQSGIFFFFLFSSFPPVYRTLVLFFLAGCNDYIWLSSALPIVLLSHGSRKALSNYNLASFLQARLAKNIPILLQLRGEAGLFGGFIFFYDWTVWDRVCVRERVRVRDLTYLLHGYFYPVRNTNWPTDIESSNYINSVAEYKSVCVSQISSFVPLTVSKKITHHLLLSYIKNRLSLIN